MNHLLRSTQGAIVLLFGILALVFFTGLILWFALDAYVGIHLPLPAILIGIGLLAVWTASSSRGHVPAVPPVPPRPRRPVTWQDIERMVILEKQGVIPREQVDAALRELMPPPPPVQPSGDRGYRGRR